MRPIKTLSIVLMASTMLAGCSLAPAYKTPDMGIPAKFKEAGPIEGKWQLSAKNPGTPDDTAWWTIFNDVNLNQMEQLAMKENNSLKAAGARLKESRALLRETLGALAPEVDVTANASRADLGRGFSPASSFGVGAAVSYDANTLLQINDATTGARANTRANEELYRQALLMVQADVAQNYYAILSLDTERDLLRKTVDLRIESQKLIERRFHEGEAGEQDFLRAKAETSTTQADLKAVERERDEREHALAVLVGKFPTDFTLEQAKLPGALPRVPAGLPASLLERRPDVAAAEQRMIQTNSQIGIARAAFFPSIMLTASGGLASPDLGNLFSWSSKSWALGPVYGTALSLPVFDFGRRIATVDVAKADFEESVADYRQQVLVAFKDVEDNLSDLRTQAEQAQNLYQAADASTKASRISDLRYKEGETSYLEALDTERDTLAVQRAYTQVQGARFVSTVNLIRALGGGWYKAVGNTEADENTPLPSADQPQQVTTSQPKAVAPIAKPPEEKHADTPVAPKAKTQPAPKLAPVPDDELAPPQEIAKPQPAPAPVPTPDKAPVAKPGQQAPAPTAPQRDFNDINSSILFD